MRRAGRTWALQLCDVLGEAIGSGVAGAIVAAAAAGIGHGTGVAVAGSFGIVVALIGVIVGARLPKQLAVPLTGLKSREGLPMPVFAVTTGRGHH